MYKVMFYSLEGLQGKGEGITLTGLELGTFGFWVQVANH